ncbi:MAG: hypothetical protein WKF59_19585 [Chitinophagaceae bacterium]
MIEEKENMPEEIPQEQPVKKEPANEPAPAAGPIADNETQPETLNLKPSTSEEMEVHHHTHPRSSQENMERLFLGILNAVPCCVLWVSGRVPVGAQDRERQGRKIYSNFYRRFRNRYCCY